METTDTATATVNDLNGAAAAPTIQSVSLPEFGVTARLHPDRGVIVIHNQDGAELFSFGQGACPLQEEPIKFLVSIFKVGFDRGKAIGREAMKLRYRELLGGEL